MNVVRHEALRILCCITFLYRPARLTYLFQVLQGLADLQVSKIDVVVFTETDRDDHLKTLDRLGKMLASHRISITFRSVAERASNLRMLPWAHKPHVRDVFLAQHCSYTHCLYLEEDIRFGQNNLDYFQKYNRVLRGAGLIPGFMRVEVNDRAQICAVDNLRPNDIRARPVTRVGEVNFVCLDEPYAAMYLLDRESTIEYIGSRSFDFEQSFEVIGWGEPERATIGLTFEKPPAPHRWRTVIPLAWNSLLPDPCAWVHHLPNTYSNNYTDSGNYPLGKLDVQELFCREPDEAR